MLFLVSLFKLHKLQATAKSLNNEYTVQGKLTDSITLKKNGTNSNLYLYHQDDMMFAKIDTKFSAYLSPLFDFLIFTDFKLVFFNSPLNLLDELFLDLSFTLDIPAFRKSFFGTDVIANSSTGRAIVPVVIKNALCLLFNYLDLAPIKGCPVLKSDILSSTISTSNSISFSDNTVVNNDLLGIYRKAEVLEESVEPVEPAEGFKLSLREYQKKGLGFLASKERQGRSFKLSEERETLSPLWAEYCLSDGIKFYFSKYSGELTLDKPKSDFCNGGILADDMGLGKTIQILSLVHTNPRPSDLSVLKGKPLSTQQTITNPSPFKKIRITGESSGITTNYSQTFYSNSATLIVCPLNVFGQWESEIKRSLPNDVNIVLYYGSSRKEKDSSTNFRNFKGIV
ncbi:DNA helicase rad5, partial [Nowakowskiella sp. JEL0078]